MISFRLIIVLLVIRLIQSQSQTLVLGQVIPSSSDLNANIGRVRAVDFSNNGGDLLLTVFGNYISIWTYDYSSSNWTFASSINATQELQQTAFSPNATRILALSNLSNNAYFYDLQSNNTYTLYQQISMSARPLSMSWSSNGNRTIFGMNDGSIQIWNFTNGKWVISQAFSQAHATMVTGVSARLTRMVSCGLDTHVKVWYFNYTTGLYIFSETNTVSSSDCTSIDYEADERRIVTGHADGRSYVLQRNNSYNYTLYKTLNNLNNSYTRVYRVKFSGDGSKIAISSQDGVLRMQSLNPNTGQWSISSENEYANDSPFSLDWRTNTTLADGSNYSSNGKVSIYQIRATNCPSDPNSNGSKASNTSCYCNYPYQYRLGYCMRINCSNVNNSIANNVDAVTCDCISGYVWNNLTMLCRRNCVNVSNSTQLNYEPGNCICLPGFTWNVDSCIVYVNCNNLPNSRGWNQDSSTCSCNTGYVYNFTRRACVIDCSNVVNSNGTSQTDPNSCSCNSGYVFNTSLCGKSGAYCLRNCTKRTAPWVRGIDCNDPTQCYCYDSFDWEVANSKCVLNCNRINYSTGDKRKNGSCKCHSGYQFDLAIYRCTSGTSDSAAVAIAVGVAVPLTIAALVGAYFYWQYRKKKKLNKVRLEHPAQSAAMMNVPPVPVTATTITTIETQAPIIMGQPMPGVIPVPISSSRASSPAQHMVFRESRHMGGYVLPPVAPGPVPQQMAAPIPGPMPIPIPQARPVIIGAPVIGVPATLSGSGISSSPGTISGNRTRLG